MTTGIQLIKAERNEQITKHGRSIEHDVSSNDMYQLSDAASILCLHDPHTIEAEDSCPHGWDATIWAKMFNKPYKERVIIAAALLAAEADRLLRMTYGTQGKTTIDAICCTNCDKEIFSEPEVCYEDIENDVDNTTAEKVMVSLICEHCKQDYYAFLDIHDFETP